VIIPVKFVREVEISTFSHATEDEDRVEDAITNLLPEENRDLWITRKTLKGYHGDPITIVTGKIRTKKGATGVLRRVVQELSSLDQQRLLDELEERLDDGGNLYIRLDKQNAYLGKVRLLETDPVKMKFRLRLPHGKDRLEYVREVINAIIKEEHEA
jgi:RNA binding exosome subunit